MKIKTKPKPEYLQDYRQRIGESIRENREIEKREDTVRMK